ncbi:glycosyl transferase [Synechocystis sp. PCC 7339]|uniref:hypothetical protein n=1 Tax=Synechocystis sp. PCC 7339 TaxID=2782213 RepID=UPI001CBADBE6|nr:hypothetical protein [Synechocystis sp. PCC 7339]UAJ71500.1 glycosyl transferase [Synechocystis sp. PCC 7339]
MDTNQQTIENFCTLFDHKFLPMGMSLHQSLLTHAQSFHLWIVCMDELVEEQLKILALPQVSLIPLKEIETTELLAIKAERSRGEYCWTITPFTFTAVFERRPDIERVTYLDADLYFFRNPQVIFKEFEESDRDVLLTEHGYAPEYDQTLLYGKFCVQFLTIKNNISGNKIIQWWKNKCLECCSSSLIDGKFGDQKYLDVWPVLFPENIWILQQKENTLAPWNVTYFKKYLGCQFSPVFYHFHSLRIINPRIILLFYGYKIASDFIPFYENYTKSLIKSLQIMKRSSISIDDIGFESFFNNWSIKQWIKYLINRKIRFRILPNFN